MTAADAKPRIGLMVRDPVRAEGLSELISHFAEPCPITPAEAVHNASLGMVIIDADGMVFNLLAAFRRARAGLRLLVFGNETDPAYIGRIVAAGAKGYLNHSASSAEIGAAISVVQEGSIWAPRKVLASLIDTYSPQEPKRPEVRFSERERQILQLLIEGRSDREIAETLTLSKRTVESAVSRMLQKVGVRNRVALTIRVLEQHLLPSA